MEKKRAKCLFLEKTEMTANPKRFTITAALPYTNGPIHIGHLAGVYIPADIFARYQRLKNNDVAFICGSDEHGVAISLKARREGKTPQAIIDYYNGVIRESFAAFGIAFDNYSRTSKQNHHQTAGALFSELYEKGIFEEKVSAQLYDPEDKQFLADRYVTGTCPVCGHTEAYGDQCEACGSALSATELINPKSTLSGATPILKDTKHWFLPLGRYQDFIEEWIIKGHKADWKPNVYGQVKSWVDNGLKARAVTRDLDWGIPVPIPGAEGKVLYVWFDAPIGYISSTQEWAAREGKDWEPYWKDKNTRLVHFIGKDNIVFHCIIFPVMLHAAGDYILPDNVPANEFLNLEGQKISTSKNWAVWLHEYLEDFQGQQDVLRYVLTANAPETKDNDFTWSEFQTRNNSELVAIFGNFVNRVAVLTHKYYQGVAPTPNPLTEEDEAVLEAVRNYPEKIGNAIEEYRFREASQQLIHLARLGNKYLADAEPWKKIKTDPERVATIMYTSLQIVAALSVLSEPLLPFTAVKLQKMVWTETQKPTWDCVQEKENILQPGTQIGAAALLFQKITDEQIQQQIDKLKAKPQGDTETQPIETLPVKPEITYDDFSALDLRIVTITAAEKIKKTKKLMQITVDLGAEQRTVVSGIAAHYSPEELIGKKVTYLANLKPRMLKGVESKGMLLLAENAAGQLDFIGPEQADVIPNGSPIS